jgi:hypothetical protein
MATGVVLSEFMMIVGVVLIAVLAAFRFFSPSHPGKPDIHKFSKTGAFHV